MMIRSASKMEPFARRNEENRVRKTVDTPDNARAIFSGWGPKL